MSDSTYRSFVEGLFTLLLVDDRGTGDVTTQVGFKPQEKGNAVIIAKQSGILAGLEEVAWFLKKHTKLVITVHYKDGQLVAKNTSILELSGSWHTIFLYERLILNVIGRLSGIATKADRMTKQINEIKLVPTRKTLWGPLDKKACLVGGAGTHRLRLSDAVLIKHNHFKATKYALEEYLESAANKSGLSFVEAEVATLKEAQRVAVCFSKMQKKGRTFCIMLDNMTPAEVSHCVSEIKKIMPEDLLIEASGGISEKNIKSYSKTGVDLLSSGELTYNAGFLDVALRVLPR